MATQTLYDTHLVARCAGYIGDDGFNHDCELATQEIVTENSVGKRRLKEST